MNICIFSGRIGRDPELRHTSSGDAVLSWSLAVDTGTKAQPATMWLDCSIWGKRAEALQPYLAKGQKITVSGRLAHEEYQAKDGTTKARLRLTADQVELPPRGDAPAQQEPQQTRKPASKTPLADMDDDIPFN